jgi:hypothetical protein
MEINIANLVFFILATIGMTHIIVDGSIMEWFRNFVKKLSQKIKFPKLGGVVDCYLCAGTWCGFFVGWVVLTQKPFEVFVCGCAGGFLANLGAVLLNLLEAMTIVNLPSDNDVD